MILWLLPAFFVLHEAEETLLLPTWLHRNRERLSQRFPALAPRLLPHLLRLTRGRFALIALEETVLVAGATTYGYFTGDSRPWFAMMLAFGMHLVGHLLQWAAWGRSLPVVATSLAGTVYCVWAATATPRPLGEWVGCALAGCALAGLNLWAMHRLVTH